MSADKRYNGDIKVWFREKNYGFIRTEQNQKIFFSSHNIQEDWKGSRGWAFDCCVPVTFVIKRRDVKGTPMDHADDVAPLFPLSEPEALNGFRETSELIKKTHDFGWVRRACGDNLFFHKIDIVPGYENRWDLLEPGSPIFHGVRWDASSDRWRASYVELYSYSELESFKNESEPEPQAANDPESEPLPQILVPENKSKTLFQLTLEKRVRHELSQKGEAK
jgi:hypothetical protein